jgi:hypothetical protein
MLEMNVNRRIEWTVASGRASRVLIIADVAQYERDRKADVAMANAQQNYDGPVSGYQITGCTCPTLSGIFGISLT